MYFPYALKELRFRGNRTLVNIFGIAVGIALFISISAVSSAYKIAAARPFKDIGADLIVQRGEKRELAAANSVNSMRGIRLPFSNQIIDGRQVAALNRIEGVEISAHALLLWEFAAKGFRTIIGVDDAQTALGAVKVHDWVKQGRFPDRPDEIALESHFARFQKVAPGDSFQIGGHAYTVTGTIGIKEGAQVAAANIYMPLAGAQMLLGVNPEAVNVIYLRLKDPGLLNAVKSQVATMITGASISSSDSFLELMGGVSMISEKFSIIASLVALAGAVLLILKTMTAHLLERSSEIGTLKAVGWTRQEIQMQLWFEIFIQAVIGGILGILLGYCISFILGFLSISLPLPWELSPGPALARQAQAANQVVRLPVTVSMPLAAAAMGLSLLVGCICGYQLSRRTAKMKPADILRQL